tara:strand:- start:224 stop:913 length:690 start_codon:yes stop_codon:yes gene_type:complete
MGKIKNIAIIPARGGSKRIVGKNYKNFNGLPIIANTINILKKSNLFDKIFVSTDSKKITSIAERFGAEVPFIRPKKLSDDYATSVEVINHSVRYLKKIHDFEYACCVYAPNPFLQIKDLKKGYSLVKLKKVDFVFSATAYPFPFFRSLILSKKGKIEMMLKKNFFKRTQDLKKIFCDAGQFYWGTKDAWLKKKTIYSKKSKIVSIPKWRYHDIDTAEDWKKAEKFIKIK